MEIKIVPATKENDKEVSNLFSSVITHTFKKEKIFNPIVLQKEIIRQIFNFRACIDGDDNLFLVAKYKSEIVATVSYGLLSDIIRDNSDLAENIYEIKSIYVLPKYHGNGIGSKIFNTILDKLKDKKAKEFCIDSGYASAQTFWTKKLGKPYKTLENYWGKGLNHEIWLVDL